jgi:hypothetical protein
MHLKALVILSVTASTLAFPYEAARNDLPTIQSVFGQITKQVEKMIANVNAFDGTSAKVKSIAADSKNIENIISKGANAIAKSKAMGLMDTISLLGDVGTMATTVSGITNALSAKRADIEKAGGTSTVLSNLKNQRTAAKQLTDAIKKNLPMSSLLGGFAEPVAKQVTDVLDKAITDWSAPSKAAAPASASAPDADSDS